MDRPSVADGDPDRRTVLRRAAAVAGTIALAGCTDDVGEEFPPNDHRPLSEVVPDLPVRERADVVESRIEALSDADVDDVDAFVAALEERDLTFEAVEEVADQLHLEYVEADIERNGTLEVTALVAGAFAAFVDAGFAGRGLELVFFAPDGSTIGLAEVAAEWAEDYVAGRLSAAEYGELVAGTIESAREPPEPDVAPDE